MKQIELYIHIPFCVKKCAYCDFLSAPASSEERAHYVELLCEEIRECRGRVKEYEVSTIFFGGGTPSLLTGEQLERIMDTIKNMFQIAADAEVTLEMNPGTVTEENLRRYYEAGINRISIGLQSVHNEELKMLGRIHTYEEFLESFHMARKVGFDNVNIDLISAIPGQTVESWKETLQTIIALNPEHISAYSLIIEPGTPFYDVYGEDECDCENDCGDTCEEKEAAKKLPDEDSERKMYWLTKKLLHEAGYERYEISNYAKDGYECRHNLGYWERSPYLGFGIGAASLVPEEIMDSVEKKELEDGRIIQKSRYSNPADVNEYQEHFKAKFSGEFLTLNEEMEEFMFLGLRKIRGICKDDFSGEFGRDIEVVYGKVLREMLDDGLMEYQEGRYFLTERGIDISNYVMSEFLL